MYLISTGKSTVLTDFNDLETKYTYQHVNSESTDFQFYANQRIFVEVNKKSGLEILRIKEKLNQKLEIQRVRKLNVENVYCVACAKKSAEEMAFGLSNGQVKLYNYINAEFVHRFNADSSRNSVVYLDYNASDEYMSSVYENGQINIFGIKTKAKIDTFNIDNNSTLARFHPTKRFYLSIASLKGAVTVYDVQTKRKYFHSADAHASPCRDLCMTPAAPDMLISVGYDCLINIFDTRRKTQPLQLRYCHPLSTVALSECGNYFCVGNLKGELTAYDLRNPKAYLATKKVHDCGVTRLAFVPTVGENAVSFSSSGNVSDSSHLERNHAVGGGDDLRKSIAANMLAAGSADATRGHRDSFCDFLDFHANKGLEKMSSRFAMRRDSFDCWDALQRKPAVDEPRVSLLPGGNVSGNNSALAGDSFDGKIKEEATMPAAVVTAPLRERSNNSMAPAFGPKLMQIEEEQPLNNVSSGSDKENPTLDLEFGSRLQILPADRNSTPHRIERRSTNIAATPAPTTVASNAAVVSCSTDLTQLRDEMKTQFQQLESELKFQMETNKWHIFTQNFNLWNKLNANNEAMCDALGILLQTDPFVHEFVRLQEENAQLKLQLQQLAKK